MHRLRDIFLWGAQAGLAFSLCAATPGANAPDAIDAAEEPLDEAEVAALEAALATPDGGVPAPPEDDPTAAHPYQAIIIRNSFGLGTPPPPPAPPVEAPPPVNTTHLKLTGIMKSQGRKQALFLFNDGKTNKLSGLVGEGERDAIMPDLEVLEIDAASRSVRVNFGGKEMTMDFVNNGLMPPTNAVAGLPPGIQNRPGVTQPLVAGAQRAMLRPGATAATPAYNPGARTLPVRPTRLGTPTVAGSPGGLQPVSLGAPVNQDGSIGGQPNVNVNVETMPALTREQEVMLIREQHRFAEENNIVLPPAPPVEGLEDLSVPPPIPMPE
jgi:hypothetical protein